MDKSVGVIVAVIIAVAIIAVSIYMINNSATKLDDASKNAGTALTNSNVSSNYSKLIGEATN